MIVNFRARKINRDTHKLIRILILIKKNIIISLYCNSWIYVIVTVFFISIIILI